MRAATYLALFAALLLWAGNWIVARAVRDDISPGIATTGRLLVVLLVLLPFTLSGLKRKFGKLQGKSILLAIGFFGGGLHLSLQWLGVHYTTATSAMLYLSTSPIFVLLMARALLVEPIGVRQWTGVAISFAGVYLIATQGHPQSLSFNIGDLMALGSMMMFSAFTVFLRLRRDDLNTIELIVVICAVGLVFNLPWAGFDLAAGSSLRLSAAAVAAVLYSAIGSLLLAYAGWSYAVTRLGAARAGLSMHLMPAMGVGMSMIFLNEYPAWFHFAGITLIFAGVALSAFRASAAAHSP